MDNLRLPLVAPISVAAAATVSSIPFFTLWHAQLGHTSSSQVQQLASRGLLGLVSTENFNCVSCQLGKQPRDKLIWPAPVLKQNIVPLLIPHLSSFSYDGFSKI